MASVKFTSADVEINGVDLSAYVRSVELPISAEMLDETAMGDDTRKNKAGLLSWNVPIEFKQDFGAGAVDATLFPLLGAASFTISIRPNGSATGTTNPVFSGSAVLESYTPIGGSVGDLLTASATFQCAGTLSRATS